MAPADGGEAPAPAAGASPDGPDVIPELVAEVVATGGEDGETFAGMGAAAPPPPWAGSTGEAAIWGVGIPEAGEGAGPRGIVAAGGEDADALAGPVWTDPACVCPDGLAGDEGSTGADGPGRPATGCGSGPAVADPVPPCGRGPSSACPPEIPACTPPWAWDTPAWMAEADTTAADGKGPAPAATPGPGARRLAPGTPASPWVEAGAPEPETDAGMEGTPGADGRLCGAAPPPGAGPVATTAGAAGGADPACPADPG